MRLSFIDWRMLTYPSLRREHITETFGISDSIASQDINEFIRQFPDAIRYDKSAKQYVPAGRYRSVTGWTPHKITAWADAAKAGCEWAWG